MIVQINGQCVPSLAAVYMVPGSFGCACAVLAAMTILAPSLAAMALPIPRLAPVIKMVFPASLLQNTILKHDVLGALFVIHVIIM